MNFRENAIDLLQRYRRDRRVLLDFILSGSLIKKVVMPPGAVTLDDVDLDQVSIDYVLNCAKKSEFNLVPMCCLSSFFFCFPCIHYILLYTGEMLELSEAIRDYHDHTGLPQMVCYYNWYFFIFLSYVCHLYIHALLCTFKYYKWCADMACAIWWQLHTILEIGLSLTQPYKTDC